MGLWATWSSGRFPFPWQSELDDLQGPFEPKPFYDRNWRAEKQELNRKGTAWGTKQMDRRNCMKRKKNQQLKKLLLLFGAQSTGKNFDLSFIASQEDLTD